MSNQTLEVVTVTLNPAIDQTISCPNFSAGEVNRVESSHSVAGGKGVNVASVLADAGHRAAATGFLGRDNASLFESLCESKQIGEQFVRLDGPTRTGIKIIDPASGETTDINFPGLTPSAVDVDALKQKLATLKAKWFVLAGSVPPGVDASIYHDLACTLKANGGKVALDTSGEPLQLALEAKPDFIKPNIHELEVLVGESLPTREAVIEAAQALVKKGIETVVVSMGAEGACVVTSEQVLMAVPPAVEVKSTVGAGDAMVAGFIAAQLRGLNLADSARLATAFSMDALTRLEAGVAPLTMLKERVDAVTITEF